LATKGKKSRGKDYGTGDRKKKKKKKERKAVFYLPSYCPPEKKRGETFLQKRGKEKGKGKRETFLLDRGKGARGGV